MENRKVIAVLNVRSSSDEDAIIKVRNYMVEWQGLESEENQQFADMTPKDKIEMFVEWMSLYSIEIEMIGVVK